MAQEGYDELMALTDSRYRLTMITARRAAQLKSGIPTLLSPEEKPDTTNTVTIAMKELETGKPIRWGDELPSIEELSRVIEPERRPERQEFALGGEQRE
ncbi:MAG TPA: DNA-directed RNA polymerase subunit omega [Trueperaceae bacterium]